MNKKSLKQSIDSLSEEATRVFVMLDKVSDEIRATERMLTKLKLNLEFEFHVQTDNDKSFTKTAGDPEKKYTVTPLTSYLANIHWYLVWGLDNKTDSFRLLLESKIDEIGAPESPWVKFKKPFIETSIGKRMQFSAHLGPFIDAFKDYIREYRHSLTGEK